MSSTQPLSLTGQPLGDRTRQLEALSLWTHPQSIRVDVASLSPGRSLRDTPIDGSHVERLVATGGEWPPLLVRRRDLVVIDGLHRLAAASSCD